MIRILLRNFIGFLQASRVPNLIIIGTTQYLTAIFLVSDYPEKKAEIFSLSFFLMVCSTNMIAAAGYIINDYFDQKIDMINRPHKVVVGVKLRRRLAMLAHLFLTFIAIFIGFSLDIKVGAIHLISSFGLWNYSLFLRKITLIGNLVIAFLTSLTLLIVPVYLERNETLVYIYSFLAMSIILVREVIKDIEDVKGESAAGCQSIPVIFGIRGAKVFIYMVTMASTTVLVSFLLTVENWIVLGYFFILFPLFLWFIFKLIKADKKADFKLLHNFTNVVIFTGLLSMIMIKPWL